MKRRNFRGRKKYKKVPKGQNTEVKRPVTARENIIHNALLYIWHLKGDSGFATHNMRVAFIEGAVKRGELSRAECDIIKKRILEYDQEHFIEKLEGIISNRLKRTKEGELIHALRRDLRKAFIRYGFLGRETMLASFNAAMARKARETNEPTMVNLHNLGLGLIDNTFKS